MIQDSDVSRHLVFFRHCGHFATLGWPDQTKEYVDKLLSNESVLVTGFDIIFFWVATNDDDGTLFYWTKLHLKMFMFMLLLEMKRVKKCQNLKAM